LFVKLLLVVTTWPSGMTVSRMGSGRVVKRGDAVAAAWSLTHAVVRVSGKLGVSTPLPSGLVGVVGSCARRVALPREARTSGVDERR
jgi:hypothetical protein